MGLQMGRDTLIASLLGAVVGTLVNAACYIESDIYNWMWAFSVPFAVVLTIYIMFFLGISDGNSRSSGTFSALFVIFVQFAYPPIADFVPQG
jgi:hypothetical protein